MLQKIKVAILHHPTRIKRRPLYIQYLREKRIQYLSNIRKSVTL